jgi:thiamine-phosphate pyrophosphorylase
MRRLYPIIHIDEKNRFNPFFVENVLRKFCPSYLQLRMKNEKTDKIIDVAKEIILIRDFLKVPTNIFINDSAQAAFSSGADGVHIGQEDERYEVIRKEYPQLKIGLSTHNLLQIEKSNEYDLEYIGFGPVFKTETKKNSGPVVGDSVEKAVSFSKHSIVFIGGINKKNIESLPCGSNIMYAVISALNDFLENEKNG